MRNKKIKKEKEIVLHLPISFGDINKKKCESNIFTLGSNSSSDEDTTSTLKEVIKEQERKIKELEEKLKNSSKIVNNSNISYKMDFNIKFKNNKIEYEKESLLCWWCHHKIENNPVFLPDKYINEKFYCQGVFCTFSCAASYNANILDDYRVSERYCFLKQMYNKMFKTNEDISLALDWKFLKSHGGYMTINEFREKSTNKNIEGTVHYPPIFFQKTFLSEKIINLDKTQTEKKIILKRSKPLPRTKNSLMNTMGLIRESEN